MTAKSTKTEEIQEPAYPGLNLYQKLTNIKGEFGALEKDGTNDFHKYNYVTEAQVMTRFKDLCVTHGVFVEATCAGISHEKGMGKHGDGILTTMNMEYKIVDIENPSDFIKVSFPGTGMDSGDKGAYKAMTGSYKYFLIKTLNLATDDDPENDTKGKESYSSNQGNRQAASPATPVRQGQPKEVQTGEYYHYDTNLGPKLGATSFQAVTAAFKKAGYKFFGKKDGYDNTWRGLTYMGERFDQLLKERPKTEMIPAPETQEAFKFDDGDDLAF